MVRLFRHYISRALLTLLVVEALYLFLAIYVGRSLWAVLVPSLVFQGVVKYNTIN
jgi:hypothetical protein